MKKIALLPALFGFCILFLSFTANAQLTVYNVTGGGAICPGTAGLDVGLDGSALDVNYQLYNGASPIGSLVAGTGSALDFGLQNMAGTYTVVADPGDPSQATMAGNATITLNPLPAVNTITGGGSYCPGGEGADVGLDGSVTGVYYQLYNEGAPAGAALPGTAVSLDFGLQTAGGNYTVIATDAVTGCNSNMNGSAMITVLALPPAYMVTGGGGYCAGDAGLSIGLANSDAGTNYYLYNGPTLAGGASGTGIAIDFGLQTLAGNYTVVAINPVTTCSSNMTGSTDISIIPLPNQYNVTGGGDYCASGTGLTIGLDGSDPSVNYQLFIGGNPTGTPVAGTGSAIDFGLQTGAGTYTVVAVNSTKGCTDNMLGTATVVIDAAPVAYAITGGGAYCAGGTGIDIGLNWSDAGILYQLYNDGNPVGSTVAGMGGALDFGLQTAAGNYTISATTVTTGCTNDMAGINTITINLLPNVYFVTGGGNYCFGGTGVSVGLNNSDIGTNYQLYDGAIVAGAPVAGTGNPLDFGLQTAGGTYTAVATDGTTGCTGNMSEIAVVGINPSPVAQTVTGGGSYCAGGAGMHIGLLASTAGVQYQLYNGVLLAGSPVTGAGGSVDLGLQTLAGTYTVIATDPVTACTGNMSGSATISIHTLPLSYTVTGGGSYCAGGTGVAVSLAASEPGVNYQLYSGPVPTGSPVSGTGFLLNFGLQTNAGTYTVKGTDITTGCTSIMSGSSTVSINPKPALHTVTGGGSYCPGGAGQHIGLDWSDAGINYQLYNGALAVGGPMAGDNSPLDFGLQTTGGVYTVVSRNTTTGCVNGMSGSATVNVSSLPVIYNVTGGGNYCPGGAGSHVGLSGSNSGVSYQLYNGSTMVGAPVTGTGFPLDFGLQTGTGNYTVTATNNATTCSSNMNGTVMVGLNPLPVAQNVTGGGNYCAGGTGVHVDLDGSQTGVYYQLYNGPTLEGTFAGIGTALDFGLFTTAGNYTVLATNTITGCNVTMTGSASVVADPAPIVYTVSGGGNYCAGGTGLNIMLSGSETGTNYQLFNGAVMTSIPVPGSGLSLDFGMQTAAGHYTVVATNPSVSCVSNMAGGATINVNLIPVAYSVTGGGNYCAGGSGVHILLSNSNTGTHYQLYNGIATVGSPLAGTGAAIDFGSLTSAGNYTVVATNTATLCTNNMTGSSTIGINPLPVVHTITGGGSYCSGGAGRDISLNGSEIGTNYQLYNGPTAIGSPVPGNSTTLDLGTFTLPGTYTIVAINPTTSCTNHMAGSAIIAINPLPAVYTVTGGGNYCTGGAGVHIGLSGSASGVSYQLLRSGVPTGSPVPGTGAVLDLGVQTTTGSYTVTATNSTTGCTRNMIGVATVGISTLPGAYAVTGGGNYCAGGAGIGVGLASSATGINYHLLDGSTYIGSPVPGTGTSLNFGLQTLAGTYTIVATNASTGCSNNMTGSATVAVNNLPTTYSVTGGGAYCAGGDGMLVGLSNSGTGVSYQLYNGTVMTGSAVPGIGAGIDFGLQTVAGIYKVIATDGSTGCNSTMDGTESIVVNPLPTLFPVVGGGSYCAGGTGLVVGLGGSNATVNYTLYSGFSTVGTYPGTGSPLSFGLQTGAATYTVMATNTITGCNTNMSGSVSITIKPAVTPVVSVVSGSGDPLCSGNIVNFTANVFNGGTAPLYQWTVNGMLASVSSTYSYTPANGDIVGVVLTSNADCATPAIVSNSKTMTVDLTASPLVSIAADPGIEVCEGTNVNFTANTSYAGTAPTYTWMKNGAVVGTSSTLSYVPVNGDIISCVLTSNYHCRLANTAGSGNLNMIVDISIPPTVSINATPGDNITPGETVTLTATVANGGPAPTYQWTLNGVAIPGAIGQVYISNTLADGDIITCEVLSSGGCSGLSGRNSITVHISNVGVKQVTFAGSNLQISPNPNKGVFTLHGSLAAQTNEEVNLEVTDMLGHVVYSQKVNTSNGEINEKIQLNNTIANGMYILSLRSGADNKVFHIVIEQ